MPEPITRPCPHCQQPYDISRRMHGDRCWCRFCGGWSAVVMFPDRTELRPCDAPQGTAPAGETTEAAALVAEMSAMRVELEAAREDNAVLLAALRDIDYSRDELPERVQRLLDRIQQVEHPGRALMAELTRRMGDLERERDAARAVVVIARRGFGTVEDVVKAEAFDPSALMRAIEAYDQTIKN